uniref:RRM domain-containing protein n=1 Tax=Oryza nivara TaxID=4536 RepID=A0A0E0HUR0_ORYNI
MQFSPPTPNSVGRTSGGILQTASAFPSPPRHRLLLLRRRRPRARALLSSPPRISPYASYRHHAYPPHPPPPPAYVGAYYDHAAEPLPPRDELRTLFIAGLPGDAKAREVYNLFRDFPGYVSSHLRTSGKSSQAYAFAVFADQPSALAAMSATNGRIFDLENNCTLHVDLAKSNSRSKRSRTDDVPYTNFEPAAFSKDPSAFAPQNNPPCPTLFVANLGPTCSEQELIDVFSSCAGFIKVKMQNKFGAPVAFVDFKDMDSSTEAINRLQGVILYSSTGEGMRLEYAKSRMGLRKQDKRQ